MIEKLLKIAETELGTKSIQHNNNKYNTEFYGRAVTGSNYNWCAVFVLYCFNRAGILHLTPFYNKDESFRYNNLNGAYTPNWVNYAKQLNQWYTDSYKVGDILLFGNNNKASHIGIVSKVNKKSIVTIEGNYSDSVATVNRQYTNYILGAFRPKYPTIDELITVSNQLGLLNQVDYWNDVLAGDETKNIAVNLRYLLQNAIKLIKGE